MATKSHKPIVWGLFAAMPGTPLDWVQFIAARKYAP